MSSINQLTKSKQNNDLKKQKVLLPTWITRLRPRGKLEKRSLWVLHISQPHQILDQFSELRNTKRFIGPLQASVYPGSQKQNIILYNLHYVFHRTAIIAQFLLPSTSIGFVSIVLMGSPNSWSGLNGAKNRHQ